MIEDRRTSRKGTEKNSLFSRFNRVGDQWDLFNGQGPVSENCGENIGKEGFNKTDTLCPQIYGFAPLA